jgi:class 3 adenylate cyclase/tetratricopeptide (TPR) repeat protein
VAGTENITVLFTDLVGSTELASSLSPEAGDEVRRNHFSALRQAIAASGGTEVKNLGDGLMVVFPAASAALACAVGMQQGVNRSNAGSEQPLGLRVGLSSGEATREADDYFGDPVIEAARLCAQAEGGRILASDLVRANAGRRSSHTFTSLGELELKGLPEPIETLEVGWEPLGVHAPASGQVPLPTRLSHRPAVGVIGRENELALLDAALKRVTDGEGRELILIAGEPGQGKTTLVSELARLAHERGMTVLLGRCDEEVNAPYRPFQEALSQFVAHVNEELLREHVASHGGELLRMVPALGQRLGVLPPPQTTDPDTERYLLYAAVVGLLEGAARQCPIVVVLDDLHWADKPSLQLLRHLVANTSSARLLIFGTYRDAELSSSHPLNESLAGLHREPVGVSSINLKGLDDTGVIAFMELAAGHELDDAGVGLAHQLYRDTDGNPFFVAEVLRNLSESGEIFQDATTGRWTAKDTEGPFTLPHSVRTVIGTRVSRLGEEATKVLSTASVIGRDFDLDLLAETTKMDEDELIDLLDEAQRAAVVNELPDSTGRYSFSHALVQHTLYEDLGATRRTRLHKAVGEAIERMYGSESDERVGELARHFFLATKPSDTEKAVTYARRAGEAALKALAPDDGVRYFTQAVELTSHGAALVPEAHIDLMINLGTAQRLAGVGDFRSTLLDAARRARELGDTERLTRAALANSRGFFSALGEIDSDKVEVIEAALEDLSAAETPDRARLLATLCAELTYHSPLERRLALAEEATAMARRLGDNAALIDVINTCSGAIRVPSTIAAQVGDCAEVLELATILDDPYRLQSSANNGRIALLCAGRFDAAAQCSAIVRTVADKLRQPTYVWWANLTGAADALLHGDAAKAEELAAAALEIGTQGGEPDAFSFYASQLMSVRRIQGRYGELVELVSDVADQNPAVPVYRAVLACCLIEADDEGGAQALFDQAAATSFVMPEDSGWIIGVGLYARAAIELGLSDGADRLFELLEPIHDQLPFSGITPLDPVATYLGGLATVLGRYDEAERYFDEAAQICTQGAMRFSEAYNNLLWGRMHLQRGGPGDADKARGLFELARSSAVAQGYARVERQAMAELSQLK